jgi:hypothetical protein
MVLVVELETLAATLDVYPRLSAKLGPTWLADNYHVPAWQYGTHPLIVGLWPPPSQGELAAWENGIRLLEEQNVPGRRHLFTRLRHASEFRSLRTEVFLVSHLMQANFTVIFPKSNDRRMPDIRIKDSRGDLDIEVKGFERTTEVEYMDVMLHAIMMHEPYSLDLQIPDTTSFERHDIEEACMELLELLQKQPFSAGRQHGRHEIAIGQTKYTLGLVSPHNGALFVNSNSFSLGEHQLRCAAGMVRQTIRDKADQLPNGGAVALDISRTNESMKWVARSLNDANVREQIWDDVPTHVHSLWLYYTPGDTEHPSMIHYSTNPHADIDIPPVVEELRIGALTERDFPPVAL